MKMDPPPTEPIPPAGPSDRDDEKDVRLLCSLAAAHMLFGRYDMAASFVALAAWISPNSRRTTELRAMIEMRRGRISNALDATLRLREAGYDLPPELELIETRAIARESD